MKTEKNIFIAFVLNLCFSVLEFFGGIYTGSVAITSDAVHDFGDAVSIGVSYFLERKSKKHADCKYTYGYGRFSVIGGAVSTLVLLAGSVAVILSAVKRLINPITINYDGMIGFAIAGVIVNSLAAFFTHHGDSLNQRAVNLHMLEDVFGWIVVLAGAIVIKFTDFLFVDPVMSLAVSVFILINAIKNLKEIIGIILDKVPENINVSEIKEAVESLDGVIDVHHIHIRTLDGKNNLAEMHVVTNGDSHEIKQKIRKKLSEYGICHVTLEPEGENEHCHERTCGAAFKENVGCGHHH